MKLKFHIKKLIIPEPSFQLLADLPYGIPTIRGHLIITDHVLQTIAGRDFYTVGFSYLGFYRNITFYWEDVKERMTILKI